MKKLATLSLSLLLITSIKATVVTVDNKSSNSGAQYTSLQTAVNAATAGDTILVAGSPVAYSTTAVSKEIHIIGVGYRPNNQLLGYSAQINTINLSSGSNNSTIQGVKASITAGNVSNIIISRCELSYFGISGSSSNITIYNNVITGSISGGSTNMGFAGLVISNNIIKGSTNLYSTPPNNILGNILFSNNLYIKSGGFAIDNGTYYYTYNATYINNVFYGTSANYSRIVNSSFSNNLSFNTTDNNFPTTGGNSGGNNKIGQDPLFVSSTNLVFDYSDDFTYPSNSPLVNAGADGTDIGIYGGAYPWPEGGIGGSSFMYSQEPQIPQVNLLNINTVSVPQNGTLNVTVKGIKND